MEFLALHVGKGLRVTQLNCQSFKVTKCNISVPFDLGSRVLFHMCFSPGSPKVGNFIQEDTNWEAFAHHLLSSLEYLELQVTRWEYLMNLLKLSTFTNGSSSEILKQYHPFQSDYQLKDEIINATDQINGTQRGTLVKCLYKYQVYQLVLPSPKKDIALEKRPSQKENT